MNEQLSNALAKLAEKLGTTADHLWAVLVHQARIEAVTDAIIILLMIPFFFIMRHLVAKAREDDWDHGDIAVPAIGSIVVNVVWLVASVFCLLELPTLLLNPEYWAIKQISEAVGK